LPAAAEPDTRMRILHVSQPVEAGVAAVVAALVKDQHERGHDVHVACGPGSALADRARQLGAVTHAWPSVRSLGLSVPVETYRLRKVVDRVDPDVVVLHSAKAGLTGRLALRGGRCTVYVPHAWSFEATRGLLATASTWWEVLAGRWTDLVVCVREDERDRGTAVGVAAAMEVVPNGVDVEGRTPRPALPARRKLGLPQRPTVVCVGRLARQKGQDLLLRAWPSVQAVVPDAHLVLVGDSPDRAALEAAAPADVLFAGARGDVDDFLAAADVVALPSRWEASPLVSLEAMAAGRPVVATDVGGVRAALGDTGVVVEPGDVPAMAHAIVGLLADPTASAAQGRRARERVVAVGDLRTCLKTWNELLSTLVAGTPGQRRSLRVVAVTELSRSLLSGALRSADIASVAGRGTADAARGAVLSALGVPVWWRGEPEGAPSACGAPVLTGQPGADRLAVAARRPGAAAAGTTTGPAVSVVVTVLDEGAALSRLIEVLVPQLAPGDELVVVDGGSTDGSLDALAPSDVVRVIAVPGAGISAGRNHGVRAARHDVIICTDAGCVPAPGFVEAFRAAYTTATLPALVSGVYTALAQGPLQHAQALACYPQPDEVRRPSLWVRSYARLFGTGYDPRFAVGRCVAFTRRSWAATGGFPEQLATGEDVSFGLAVARHGECVASTEAMVGWAQRDGLSATWRMYRGYGRASTDGGHPALLARDTVRGLAYLAAAALLTRRRARRLVALGVSGYLSLPLARAVRARASTATVALLPVALAVKDLGKLTGAVEGALRRATGPRRVLNDACSAARRVIQHPPRRPR
jgi:glycosyltransferase involved in cell wall biosynthesis